VKIIDHPTGELLDEVRYLKEWDGFSKKKKRKRNVSGKHISHKKEKAIRTAESSRDPGP